MNFKAAAVEEATQPNLEEQIEVPLEKEEPKTVQAPVQVTQDDLFSAHDFDITIDLEVPLPSK